MQDLIEKNRKTLRLKEYDYSATGMYFITICTHERKNILSRIILDKEIKHTVGARCTVPRRYNNTII